MSDVEGLTKENTALKNQIAQFENVFRSNQAQIQAQKELIDEATQTACVVRTNFILIKSQNNALQQELAKAKDVANKANIEASDLTKKVENLTQQVDTLTKQIESLNLPQAAA